MTDVVDEAIVMGDEQALGWDEFLGQRRGSYRRVRSTLVLGEPENVEAHSFAVHRVIGELDQLLGQIDPTRVNRLGLVAGEQYHLGGDPTVLERPDLAMGGLPIYGIVGRQLVLVPAATTFVEFREARGNLIRELEGDLTGVVPRMPSAASGHRHPKRRGRRSLRTGYRSTDSPN